MSKVHRINRRIKKLMALILIPFILTGCWDQMPFELTGFVTIIGVEESSNEDMKLTFGMPVIDPDAESKWEILDTTAKLLREGRNNLRSESGKTLEAGKTQLLFYSDAFASKGLINSTNEIFERDPSDPIIAWVVVVDGSPQKLIHGTTNFKDKPRPVVYLTGLLLREANSGYTMETRIFNFDITANTPGIDNIAPLVKLTDNSVAVQGSALFSKGKMSGSIDRQQNGLLMAMMGTLKRKQYTYFAAGMPNDKQTPKNGIAINLNQNSKRINISIKNNKPVIDIYLNLSGYIDEYKYDHLKNENEVKNISNNVQNQLQNDCQRLIAYMQEIDSDPIGIGDMVRAKKNAYWNTVDWHQAYKSAVINAHVKFDVIQFGSNQ